MSNGASDPWGNLTRMWTEMAAEAWRPPLAGGTESPELFSKARGEMMCAWSEWCEQWMRSSAFLDAQKQSLDGNLAVHKQFRANLRRMQRELQLAGREDIDALATAIRRSERRLGEQFEEMSARLKALDLKLDRLLGQRGARSANVNGASGGSPKRDAKKRRQAE